MPVENNPNTSHGEGQLETPDWINKWGEVAIDLQKGNPKHLTYEELQEKKMLDMTRTAVDAASSQYISGRVENYAFVNTPDVFAPQPLPVEVIHYTQLSEKELSARIEDFRKTLLNDETIEQFISQPTTQEGATRQDYDLAA